MLRVTAGHDIEYPLRSAGSAVAYYLQDGKEPPGVWAGTAAEALGLTGQVDPEVYRQLFGKLIVPTGERLYSGRPRPHPGRLLAILQVVRHGRPG